MDTFTNFFLSVLILKTTRNKQKCKVLTCSLCFSIFVRLFIIPNHSNFTEFGAKCSFHDKKLFRNVKILILL